MSAKFIKLTTCDHARMWINPIRIVAFSDMVGSSTTVLTVVDTPEARGTPNRLTVRETPEQILKLIEEAK